MGQKTNIKNLSNVIMGNIREWENGEILVLAFLNRKSLLLNLALTDNS